MLAYAGLDVRGAPVDEHGIDVAAIDAPVVLATPAHQCPTGVVLSPARRGELIGWARAGGLVIEDDYDAEFRYDRAPLAALQGLAPDHVVYLGTASKTLAPGLRLGWLVLPAPLIDAVARGEGDGRTSAPRRSSSSRSRGCWTAPPTIATCARRAGATAPAATRCSPPSHAASPAPPSAASRPGCTRSCACRGRSTCEALVALAGERSLGVYPLSWHFARPAPQTDALVLGYANLPEPAIDEGIRRLSEVLDELWMAPPTRL